MPICYLQQAPRPRQPFKLTWLEDIGKDTQFPTSSIYIIGHPTTCTFKLTKSPVRAILTFKMVGAGDDNGICEGSGGIWSQNPDDGSATLTVEPSDRARSYTITFAVQSKVKHILTCTGTNVPDDMLQVKIARKQITAPSPGSAPAPAGPVGILHFKFPASVAREVLCFKVRSKDASKLGNAPEGVRGRIDAAADPGKSLTVTENYLSHRMVGIIHAFSNRCVASFVQIPKGCALL